MSCLTIFCAYFRYQIKRTHSITASSRTLGLELRQNVDYGILRVTVVVVGISAKMGMDHRNATNYVSMRKQADT